jgi:hypothetical protein
MRILLISVTALLMVSAAMDVQATMLPFYPLSVFPLPFTTLVIPNTERTGSKLCFHEMNRIERDASSMSDFIHGHDSCTFLIAFTESRFTSYNDFYWCDTYKDPIFPGFNNHRYHFSHIIKEKYADIYNDYDAAHNLDHEIHLRFRLKEEKYFPEPFQMEIFDQSEDEQTCFSSGNLHLTIASGNFSIESFAENLSEKVTSRPGIEDHFFGIRAGSFSVNNDIFDVYWLFNYTRKIELNVYYFIEGDHERYRNPLLTIPTLQNDILSVYKEWKQGETLPGYKDLSSHFVLDEASRISQLKFYIGIFFYSPVLKESELVEIEGGFVL